MNYFVLFVNELLYLFCIVIQLIGSSLVQINLYTRLSSDRAVVGTQKESDDKRNQTPFTNNSMSMLAGKYAYKIKTTIKYICQENRK